MNEQKIQELKDSLREIVGMISAREGPMPEDLKVVLAQVIEHVANRIQELRKEDEGLIQKQPEIYPAMPSSNIFGFNYDYDKNKLLVKFQGNDGVGQGPVYSFDGVQPYIFDLFKRGAAIAKTTGSNKWGSWWKGKSPSAGSAFYHLIRNHYPYQRLS